jgi:hypothetical protein
MGYIGVFDQALKCGARQLDWGVYSWSLGSQDAMAGVGVEDRIYRHDVAEDARYFDPFARGKFEAVVGNLFRNPPISHSEAKAAS